MINEKDEIKSNNPSFQLSIKNFLVEKTESTKVTEDNIVLDCDNEIKNKRINKRKRKKNKQNKNYLKKTKKNKLKYEKKSNMENTEVSKVFKYFNEIAFKELDPEIEKFSPWRNIPCNVIWFYLNFFYFNNEIYFSKDSLKNWFYDKIENLNKSKLSSSKIDYLLINQLWENNQLINSTPFLKNFESFISFDKFDLFDDIIFINKFNKLKQENLILNENINNWKNITINGSINIYLKKIADIRQNINNKFTEIDIEKKYSYEKDWKFINKEFIDGKSIDINKILVEEENFMNILEKKKKTINSTLEEELGEEEYYCHVCNNTEHSSKNEIIFCSFCNISVHIKCYGLNTLPKDEEWICQVCYEFGDSGRYLSCGLCPLRGGILKQTTLKIDTNYFEKKNLLYNIYLKKCKEYNQTNSKLSEEKIKERIFHNNKDENYIYNYIKNEEYVIADKKEPLSNKVWVHLSCTYWSPEMYVNGKNNNEVLGLLYIDKKRFNYSCSICNQFNGASIKCNNRICNKYFHIECARRNGFYLEVSKLEGRSFEAFCNTHKPFQLKRVITQRDKKIKEEIEKFCNNLLKFLKDKNLIENKILRVRNTIKLEKEENKKLEVEELVNYLNHEQIYFLNKVKSYVFEHPNNCFKLKLSNNKIVETIKPKKNFLCQNIGKVYEIFGKYAEDNKFTYSNIYKFYSNIVKELKELESNQSQKDAINQKIANNRIYLNSNNFNVSDVNIMELGQNYCNCNRPWDGELMFECDICKLWFHPECQNINPEDLAKEEEDFNSKCISCNSKMVLE